MCGVLGSFTKRVTVIALTAGRAGQKYLFPSVTEPTAFDIVTYLLVDLTINTSSMGRGDGECQ